MRKGKLLGILCVFFCNGGKKEEEEEGEKK